MDTNMDIRNIQIYADMPIKAKEVLIKNDLDTIKNILGIIPMGTFSIIGKKFGLDWQTVKSIYNPPTPKVKKVKVKSYDCRRILKVLPTERPALIFLRLFSNLTVKSIYKKYDISHGSIKLFVYEFKQTGEIKYTADDNTTQHWKIMDPSDSFKKTIDLFLLKRSTLYDMYNSGNLTEDDIENDYLPTMKQIYDGLLKHINWDDLKSRCDRDTIIFTPINFITQLKQQAIVYKDISRNKNPSNTRVFTEADCQKTQAAQDSFVALYTLIHPESSIVSIYKNTRLVRKYRPAMSSLRSLMQQIYTGKLVGSKPLKTLAIDIDLVSNKDKKENIVTAIQFMRRNTKTRHYTKPNADRYPGFYDGTVSYETRNYFESIIIEMIENLSATLRENQAHVRHDFDVDEFLEEVYDFKQNKLSEYL